MANRPRSAPDLLSLTILALVVEKPRHPYEMQRLIRERGKAFAFGTIRSLYHTVEKLVKDGLIEPAETLREGKRPERTVYRATEEGCEEFKLRLKELLSTLTPEYPVFEAAMSLIPGLCKSEALQALRLRTIALEGWLADVDTRLRAYTEHLPRLFLVEVEYARAMRQAELEWVRSIIVEIESGALNWEWDNQQFENNPLLQDS